LACAASPFVKKLFGPVLELTHNHGTETDADFKHFHGNEEGRQGFGHIGFLCEDVDQTCDALVSLGATFHKKPMDGKMKGLAFANDPDGYRVEVFRLRQLLLPIDNLPHPLDPRTHPCPLFEGRSAVCVFADNQTWRIRR